MTDTSKKILQQVQCQTFPIFLRFVTKGITWGNNAESFKPTRRIFAFTLALCLGETLFFFYVVSQGFIL